MRLPKSLVVALAALTFLGGVAGCGDDAGEDEIGDGEIIDEGD